MAIQEFVAKKEAVPMVNLIIQLIIALLIAGFVFWIWQKLKPIIASIIAEPFMSLVDICITILIAAIVLFYVIIPLIRTAGNLAGIH